MIRFHPQSATNVRLAEQRLVWLRAHPDLWRDAPSEREDVTDVGRAALLTLGEAMIHAGLYSPRTEAKDRAWGLRLLIGKVRRGA